MVNQLGTPTPLHCSQLPSAINPEPYLIHHIIVVHIGGTLCNILWELVKVTVFGPQPIVHQNTTVFGVSQKTSLNFRKTTL